MSFQHRNVAYFLILVKYDLIGSGVALRRKKVSAFKTYIFPDLSDGEERRSESLTGLLGEIIPFTQGGGGYSSGLLNEDILHVRPRSSLSSYMDLS